jgi:hypothetical protein
MPQDEKKKEMKKLLGNVAQRFLFLVTRDLNILKIDAAAHVV